MWVNPLFDETSRASSLDLVRSNPLATVIVGDPLRVSHLPVLLKETGDGSLELIGHVPRVDPIADGLIAGARAIVVFHGARSYISPSSYVQPGLPTYNYLVAHLEGDAQVMTDPEELRAHLLDLTATHEHQYTEDGQVWTPNHVAHARMDVLMPLIVGFRIPVATFQAKAKLGQNRPIEDQRSAAQTLARSAGADAQEISRRMLQSSDERSNGEA